MQGMRTAWHYDRDEYVAVRLAESDNEETRLLRDLANLRAEAMPIRARGCHTVALFLVRQCMLWATLAEKVSHSGYWMTNAYAMAPHIFDVDGRFSQERILREFGLRQHEIAREARRGGLLFSSRQFERIVQLGHAELAIQSLLSIDLDAILDRMAATVPADADSADEWRLSVESCRGMKDALVARVLPVAFSTLWIWKGHVRSRGLWHDEENERVILWRCCLRLYGICAKTLGADAEETDFQIAPTDLPGVFHGNVSGTADIVLDTPILRQTLKELWITWTAVTWREPGLTVGRDFHVCVHLLMLRAGFFATYSGTRELFDYMRYVYAPEFNLDRDVDDMELTVSRAFLVDTERTFHQLLEASLTARYLTPIEHTPTIRAPPDKHRRWHERVHAELTDSTESFVQRQIEKRGWARYVYWDEVERSLVKSHSHYAMPRKALADFRQGDLDAVLEVLRGKNPLSLLWDSALAAVSDDERRRDATMHGASDAERCSRGWAWRITWDIRKERERTHGKRDHVPQDVEEIVDEASGETFYVYRASRRRVRGEALQRILLSKSVEMSAAGRATKNLLEETVLKAMLYLEKKQNEELPPLVAFSTYSRRKHLTLAHLLSRGTQPPHKIQERLLGERPVLISHHNSYYVFDGRASYAQAENLLDAMYAWCLVCENLVRERLTEASHKLDPDAAADANELMLREAENAVSQIPASLRELFELQRDPLVMQPVSNAYHLPEDVSLVECEWDQRNIAAFFVRHHRELEVSRTIVTSQQWADSGDSSYRDEDGDDDEEEEEEDEELDQEDSLYDAIGGLSDGDEDDIENVQDIGQILGGIAL